MRRMRNELRRHWCESEGTLARENGMRWYGACFTQVQLIASEGGVNMTRGLIGAFAALSPRVSYAENVRMMKVLVATGDAPGLGQSVRNAVDCLERDDYPHGRKTKAFAQAIGGDRDALVLDTWALRAVGMCPQPNAKEFAQAERAYRKESHETGINPRDFQAVVWCQVRGSHD